MKRNFSPSNSYRKVPPFFLFYAYAWILTRKEWLFLLSINPLPKKKKMGSFRIISRQWSPYSGFAPKPFHHVTPQQKCADTKKTPNPPKALQSTEKCFRLHAHSSVSSITEETDFNRASGWEASDYVLVVNV